MIAAFVEPYRRYADFNGRTSRRQFWLYQLGYVSFLVLLGVADAALAAAIGARAAEMVALPAFVVFMLGSMLPRIALTVRRLHDTGKGGATYFWTLIPYAGWVIWAVLCCRQADRTENGWGHGPDDDPQLMALFS